MLLVSTDYPRFYYCVVRKINPFGNDPERGSIRRDLNGDKTADWYDLWPASISQWFIRRLYDARPQLDTSVS